MIFSLISFIQVIVDAMPSHDNVNFIGIVWKDIESISRTGGNGSNELSDFSLRINRTVIGQANDGKCGASASINYGRGHRAAKYQRHREWTGWSW